jgi:predicted PurR-regulated permease PerM
VNEQELEASVASRFRDRPAQSLALGILTLSSFTLSLAILRPFTSVLAWALALSIATYPWFNRVLRLVHDRAIAAASTIAAAIIVIVGPLLWITHMLIYTSIEGMTALAERAKGQHPFKLPELPATLSKFFTQLDEVLHFQQLLDELAQFVTQSIPRLVTSSVVGVVELALIFFITFFFIRDGDRLLRQLQEVIPLAPAEVTHIFARVGDTVHATIYGVLVVAMIQGALGGLIFWYLHLPHPTIWAIVMGVLAVIPYLGAFVVWIPAAFMLMASGEWRTAGILVIWGLIVIGLSDNLIYPFLVGKRMHFHTLVIFLFLLGGVFMFGGAGVILGPVVLAVTHGVLQAWHGRFISEPMKEG